MGVLRRRWFQVFVSGLILLYLVEQTLVATSNPNYMPSIILLGAFLVPITFVTYLKVEQHGTTRQGRHPRPSGPGGAGV